MSKRAQIRVRVWNRTICWCFWSFYITL